MSRELTAKANTVIANQVRIRNAFNAINGVESTDDNSEFCMSLHERASLLHTMSEALRRAEKILSEEIK